VPAVPDATRDTRGPDEPNRVYRTETGVTPARGWARLG